MFHDQQQCFLITSLVAVLVEVPSYNKIDCRYSSTIFYELIVVFSLSIHRENAERIVWILIIPTHQLREKFSKTQDRVLRDRAITVNVDLSLIKK